MKRIVLFSVLLISLSASKPEPTLELNKFMDDWHVAAGKANYDGYFGVMDESFVFLGTAPGERWTKTEFSAFSKPYFDAGKAWDFKPSNRKWSFSKNRKVAWFDEDLDTWMRGCRGTGILAKKKGEWVLVYYNLHVLIENEKIKKFIDLRDEEIVEEKDVKDVEEVKE